MKSFLFISFLVLTSSVAAIAQTDKISSCPKINFTDPAGALKPDEPIPFTASLSEEAEKFNLQYNWTVLGGEIIEGQGTLSVKALQKNIGGSLTLTLEVNGLPQECKKTASETVFTDPPPQIKVIEEFSITPSQIDRARLDNLLASLKNDPSATAYIIESFAGKITRNTIERKNHKIFDYIKTKGIDKDRIILLNADDDRNLTRFYLVPSGTNPPSCDDCVTAN